jgi:hypothetical protein
MGAHAQAHTPKHQIAAPSHRAPYRLSRVLDLSRLQPNLDSRTSQLSFGRTCIWPRLFFSADIMTRASNHAPLTPIQKSTIRYEVLSPILPLVRILRARYTSVRSHCTEDPSSPPTANRRVAEAVYYYYAGRHGSSLVRGPGGSCLAHTPFLGRG